MSFSGPRSTQNSNATDFLEEESSEIFSEINITPLTDVFLVLLIIFMVTSSVMNQLGVDVNLPQTSQGSAHALDDKSVVVTLLPGGLMKVAEHEIAAGDWNMFQSILKKAFNNTNSRSILLEGDRKAFLGQAIELMDRARAVGAKDFALAASALSE